MDRSLAARLGRPVGSAAPGPRRVRAGRADWSGGRRTGGSPRRARAGLLGGLGASRLALARAALALLRAHRRARLALVAAFAALSLCAVAWVWFRTSSFVAVEHVRVSGVSGPDAGAIEAALSGEARRMSTLDVHDGALLAAVARFRVVREVHASPRFPHGLSIHVVEQLPVAALTFGSLRTAVAADGTVLGPALLSGSLPTLDCASVPSPGRRVGDASLLGALDVLGAAPAPLARYVTRAYSGPRGLTVAMRDGLLVYFGDATRPHAKWLSLARVLADPSSAGASYVDVRLPERPAAGFPAGVAPPAADASGATPGTGESASERSPTSEESTIAALASGLSAAGAGGAATGAPAQTASGGATEPTSAGGEASSGAGGEASRGPGGEASSGPGGEASSGAGGGAAPETAPGG
jgi:cell division protein FtsQ